MSFTIPTPVRARSTPRGDSRFPASTVESGSCCGVRRRLALPGVLITLLTTGCAAVGPRHVPPQPSVPVTWTVPAERGRTIEPADARTLARWWTTLNDPALTSLIERGVAGNLDIRQAQARVREARARRGLASAERFPTLTAGASATNRTTDEANTTLYFAGFDASWEADVFGGQRRGLEAATAALQASAEDLRDVLVTLTSEVALNYIEVRLAQARLATANANLQTQIETYEIAQFRFQAGLTTELDVDQARSNLEQTRASIPTLRTALAQAMSRVAVLLGRSPGTLVNELAAPRGIPSAPVTVAVGLPADVLRRRPDVRRAERQLAAQTAQVGVAAANRYPRLSLVGSIGLEALSLGNLLSAAARALVAGVNVTQTVFDAGRIRQNIEVQTAFQEQAAVAFEASVLAALEEAESALVAYAEEQARRQALIDATDAARRAVALADERYRSGLIDFLVVLDAQRSLLSLEDQLTVFSGTVTSNVIRLYKAVGGGWTPGAAAGTQ